MDLDVLLEKHGDEIRNLRRRLEEVCGDGEEAGVLLRGDLNLLRYVLSGRGDLEKAVRNILKDEKFRRENAEWMEADMPPNHEAVKDVFVADVIGQAKNGTVLFVIRSGLTAQKIKALPNAEEMSSMYPFWMTYVKEVSVRTDRHGTYLFLVDFSQPYPFPFVCAELTLAFLTLVGPTRFLAVCLCTIFQRLYKKCTEETLKRRWLTKVVLINDMSSMPFFLNVKFLAGFGESSKLSEFLHPQLLETQVRLSEGDRDHGSELPRSASPLRSTSTCAKM